MIKVGSASLIGALGFAGYIATHPIPGTGALRTLFLLLIIASVLYQLKTTSIQLRFPKLDLVGSLLIALTAWLAVQSALIAVEPNVALKVFATEWGKTLLIALIGLCLATLARTEVQRLTLVVALLVGYFIHVISTLSYSLFELIVNGRLIGGNSLFGNFGYVSPLVDAALAIMLADVTGRVSYGQRLLPLSNLGLSVGIGLALLATLSLAAKASALVIIGMGCMLIAILAKRQGTKNVVVLSVLAIFLIGGGINFSIRERWAGTFEAIRQVSDTKNQLWMNYDPERVERPHGDGSIYLRVAWAKVGLEGISAHPLGLGYGSDAFGRYLDNRFGLRGWVSSHSGWIDFTLANGIPGMLLLLAVGLALGRHSWLAFANQNGHGGLALAFLTFCYLFRGMIDGHLSASRLLGFALASAVLWKLAENER